MSYIDTCILQVFSDRKDSLRKDYEIGSKKIDSLLKNKSECLCIPMPALGEAICMIRRKAKDRSIDVITELYRLIDADVLTVCYLNNAYDTFAIAKELSERVDDDRDWVSPMDAFIAASAVVDGNCTTLYTTDQNLISNYRVSDIIQRWRDKNDYPELQIRDIPDLLKL